MPLTRYGIQEACTAHILRSLDATEPRSKPYPHFWSRGFLPEDIYGQMLTSSPDLDQLGGGGYGSTQRNGEVSRFALNLVREKMDVMPTDARELWYGVRDAVGSLAVKRAVFAKLAHGLAYRFGIHRDQAVDIEAFPQLTLFRETEGYFIKPHPDTRKKIVTLQIALPADDTQQELGTSMYQLSANPLRLLQEPRGFVEVGRHPFLPNSVFSFSVINTARLRSWHGRTALPPGCGFRNSLLVVYYANPADANAEIVEEQYQRSRAA
ncbi:MAG: hypothetical protein ABI614_03385 [Planctomycetota bacterium]